MLLSKRSGANSAQQTGVSWPSRGETRGRGALVAMPCHLGRKSWVMVKHPDSSQTDPRPSANPTLYTLGDLGTCPWLLFPGPVEPGWYSQLSVSKGTWSRAPSPRDTKIQACSSPLYKWRSVCMSPLHVGGCRATYTSLTTWTQCSAQHVANSSFAF